MHNDLARCCCHGASREQLGRGNQKESARVYENGHFCQLDRARNLTPSSNQPTWKSTRSSSGPRRRTSNAELDFAPFLLVPLAPIPAGFSYGADGFYDARTF